MRFKACSSDWKLTGLVWRFRSPHDEPVAVMMGASKPPHWREGKASKRRAAMSGGRSNLLILALPGQGENSMLASNKDAGIHPAVRGKQS
jgi:hypothetical protein